VLIEKKRDPIHAAQISRQTADVGVLTSPKQPKQSQGHHTLAIPIDLGVPICSMEGLGGFGHKN
jgi:hypothetical protein